LRRPDHSPLPRAQAFVDSAVTVDGVGGHGLDKSRIGNRVAGCITNNTVRTAGRAQEGRGATPDIINIVPITLKRQIVRVEMMAAIVAADLTRVYLRRVETRVLIGPD